MSQVVVFSNQKGGVGKTTLTRELGIYLSLKGKKVLLIDCDPQANLSRGLVEEEEVGLYQALTGESLEITNISSNLSLLSGHIRLASLEKSLIAEVDCYLRLRELLAREAFKKYELILVDTPPSLGVLTLNSLVAASHLVIPMRPALYTLQGTNDLMHTVAKVRKSLNPQLELLGVIINSLESLPVISKEIKQEIQASFEDKLFKSHLSKSIKIEEAIAEGKGLSQLKGSRYSKQKQEIEAIGEELLKRLGGGA